MVIKENDLNEMEESDQKSALTEVKVMAKSMAKW